MLLMGGFFPGELQEPQWLNLQGAKAAGLNEKQRLKGLGIRGDGKQMPSPPEIFHFYLSADSTVATGLASVCVGVGCSLDPSHWTQ